MWSFSHQSGSTGRLLRAVTCALAAVIFGPPHLAHAQSTQAPQVFSAVGQTDVTAAIAAFKAAIGGTDNGTADGGQPTGFRQVTWDDLSDAQADPHGFQFYESPHGLGIYGPYVGGGRFDPTFRVSANASNPTATPILFGQPSLYVAYSPQRILRTVGTRTEFQAGFRVASGTGVAAKGWMVRGFGAVFINEGVANSSSLEFLDPDRRSLGKFFVPPGGSKGVSFLGVLFPAARVATVNVTAGNATTDLVAMDDFIYSEPQVIPPVTLTIATPTTAPTFTATGPFVSLTGMAANGLYPVTWRSDRVDGDRHPADGLFTDWTIPDIPLAPGPNVISVTASDYLTSTTATLTVNSGATFSYYLAEGSTGGFFDTDLSLFNPNAVNAPVTLKFLREDGTSIVRTDTIAPMSRKTVHVDSIPGMEGTAFSTIVVSEDRQPLAVERAMFWDKNYYGGKGAKAVDQLSSTWYFAEGVQNSFFNTFILLENPGDAAAEAELTFQLEFGEPPVVHHVALPPLSRVTVDAGTIPAILGRSFGLTVNATQPIVAERSTYFETTPTQLWSGGHGSPGVTFPATYWTFAEGATGSFRDTFLLLGNPGDTAANITAYFTLADGRVLSYADTVPARGRLTLPLNTITTSTYTGPATPSHALADAEFSMYVVASAPIVAERAMYWHGAPGPWADGTSAFGGNTAGLRWAFAEGRVGGPLNFHSYIRIVGGRSGFPADVRVTFVKSDGTTVLKTYSVIDFMTIDVNAIPELQNDSFSTIIESTNGQAIYTERSMYWDANGVFWAGGIATAGTHLP